MNFSLFKRHKSTDKQYLGLFLKENEGIALVMENKQNILSVLNKEKFVYSNGWENITEDIDETLFKLENKLKIHLNDTIFFLYAHLIDIKSKEINKPYLTKVKNIVKNLELKAMGYIDCYQAIADYLEKKEELPLTAVIIELDKTNVSVFVYKGGKIVFSKIISRTNNFIDDLETAFYELNGKVLLPARIIIYNSKDLENEATNILSHRWSEELFIQLPRVEILRDDEIINSLVQVFGKQIQDKSNNIKEQLAIDNENMMGFTIGKDITEENIRKDTEEIKENFSNAKLKLTIPKFIIFNPISNLKIKLSQINLFSKLNITNNPTIKKATIVLGLLFIITGLLLNEFFFHKAKLIIYLPSKAVEKVSLATYEKDKKSDIQIHTATHSSEFSTSINTTGKREIGEKAKGEVTIHNFDDKEKNFTKGTKVETNNIQFVLDDEVKVASSSLTSDASAKLPGKSKVHITATSIGPESNISKGQRFKIEDLSQSIYFAINENPISGGSKKQVRTASKEDIDKLKSLIIDKGKQYNKNSKNLKLTKNDKIIEKLTEYLLSNSKFSKEVGEEADTIELRTNIDMIIYYYKIQQMDEYLKGLIKTELDDGYKIDKEFINYNLEKASKKDDRITLQVKINTKLIKDISTDDIFKKIIGINEKQLSSILKNQFKVQGYNIKINQSLPLFKDRLPYFKKNIDLSISSL